MKYSWAIFDGDIYISSFEGTVEFAKNRLKEFERVWNKKLDMQRF